MMQYFELVLTVLVLFSGLLTLAGVISKKWRLSKVIKTARSYFPVLLLVLVIRSFIFQPFTVISGSLEPTVLIGDYLAVNQSAYGLKLPVLHTKIFPMGEPKIGDIALFYYPSNPKLVFVKRVVGTPGDHVVYRNKELIINGQLMTQSDDGFGFDVEPDAPSQIMHKKIEDLNGIKHHIFVGDNAFGDDIDVIVPEGHYFMMGDNRDDSDDSRHWGFVPEANLIGRAYRIIMSWDSGSKWFRFNRIGKKFQV